MAEPTPRVSSIRDRISALNLEQVAITPNAPAPYVFDAVDAPKRARPPPPPPPSSHRPAAPSRTQTTNVPPIQSNAPTTARHVGNQPAPVPGVKDAPNNAKPSLPPRPAPPARPTPALPPRKASDQSIRRRESAESVSTIASSHSSISAISTRTSFSARSNNTASDTPRNRVLAPVYDPASLPPLPPKKQSEVLKPERVPLKPVKSAPTVTKTASLVPPPALPGIRASSTSVVPPPALPSRPPLPTSQSSVTPIPEPEARPPLPSRQSAGTPKPELPRNALPKRSALEYGLNKSTDTPPPLPASRPGADPSANDVPPPIPLSSRPNLAQLNLSKPKPSSTGSCLKCRDFSAADSHAARFPRESIPSTDLSWIAQQLTSPFPSATDKARALFTWLHHNISYDVQAFYSGNLKPSTPSSTISTGLAVCEGYAGLFAALALAAGLEALVVSGHGKGYGHTALAIGAPIPPYNGNHAWSAVRIDGGEWKLIDCCWGAGNVQGPGKPYNKDFTPYWFIVDNEEFGIQHFPEDRSRFYRMDGRALSWEEYMLEDAGERVQVYGDADKHGFSKHSFAPREKRIRVYDPAGPAVLRFQFERLCPHWDPERHGGGKPYLFILSIHGRDGRKEERLPFVNNGRIWWVDVERVMLGAPCMKIQVHALTSFDGKDGRGLTLERFKERIGRCGWAASTVAEWELS